MRILRGVRLAVVVLFFAQPRLSFSTSLPFLDRSAVLQSTFRGLEKLRSSHSGLIQDALFYKDGNSTVENPYTTPTDIALDLIFQSGQPSVLLLVRLVDSVQKLPRDLETGLFYGWYNVESFEVMSKNISSVDNLHLTLALWTLSEAKSLPEELRQKALTLFQGMDFSIFLDLDTNLIRGNYFWVNGHWQAEGYFYSHYGSEARSLYVLGYVLDLFKTKKMDLAKSLQALAFEFSVDRTQLMLWDGGAFQLFLPELLFVSRNTRKK